MDLEFSLKLQSLLQENKIAECIEITEDELIQQSKTDFRKIIGRDDLLKQTKKLNKWIGKFYKSANKKIYLKSICSEMIKLDINTDNWYLDIFAYDNFGGDQDFEWLGEWQHENPDRDSFHLKGFEDIQTVFKKFKKADDAEKEANSVSAKLCETLVVLRLFELFESAQDLAIEKEKKWINVPLIVKADGSELIYLLQTD